MSSAVSVGNREVRSFLDGVFVESNSDATVEGVNPSTGKSFLWVPVGNDADVDRAVQSCRTAFEDGRWSQAPPSFRQKALHRLADLIQVHAPELDVLDAEEMGKPVSVQFCNAEGAARLARFYAEASDKVTGDVFGSDKFSFVTQRRVPRGVVAAIVPWNFPTYCAVLKFAPALAAGNSVVLKPSELSSRSAMRLAHLAVEAGIPTGVLNMVPGLGATVGRALGLHLDVDMITFTGSTEVGKQMLQYAGQSNMKMVMTECGGKSPQIVFADGVDLDAASDSIAKLFLTNQGQICSVGSRLLVHHAVQETMIDKVVARTKQIVMGNALDAGTTFGPLVSLKQCTRVMQYIQNAAEQDRAYLVTGGRRAIMESGGYFVEPTVFSSVSPSARIAQEEIFGPVLSVIPFRDESEAIRIANGTTYGLAAYVWTANLSTAMRMAKGIRSTVVINSAAVMGEGAGNAGSHEPFGQSGLGAEGGLAGMESYLRRQLVAFNYA